ncbi:MAG: hypothetical protein Q9172_000575 [Xanthocarpia lactea]
MLLLSLYLLILSATTAIAQPVVQDSIAKRAPQPQVAIGVPWPVPARNYSLAIIPLPNPPRRFSHPDFIAFARTIITTIRSMIAADGDDFVPNFPPFIFADRGIRLEIFSYNNTKELSVIIGSKTDLSLRWSDIIPITAVFRQMMYTEGNHWRGSGTRGLGWMSR